MVLYVDVLFFINMAVDMAVLLAAGRFAGTRPRRLRLLAAGAFGGAYALAAVFWNMPAVVKLLAGGISVWIAFGYQNRATFCKRFLLFLVVSAAFAGFVMLLYFLFHISSSINGVYYLQVPGRIVLAAICLAYGVIGLLFYKNGKHIGKETEELIIGLGEREITLTALVDSGNDLTEPISHKPVILIHREQAAKLLPPEAMVLPMLLKANNAADILASIQDERLRVRFRLVPYRALGQANGLLAAFQPDYVRRRKGGEIQAYIGISENQISFGSCEGLIGTI